MWKSFINQNMYESNIINVNIAIYVLSYPTIIIMYLPVGE